jgi:hypothetical protein
LCLKSTGKPREVAPLNPGFANADHSRVIVLAVPDIDEEVLMEHVVFYPGHDAAPAFRRFSSLDESVRFVEHLRNAEGVSDVSVHMLTEVPVAFRAYYKVEVPPGEMIDGLSADVPAQPVAPVEPMVEPMVETPELVEATVADADATANGKRSLGFFAH